VVVSTPGVRQKPERGGGGGGGLRQPARAAFGVPLRGRTPLHGELHRAVSPEQFLDAIKEAAFKVGADLQLVHERYKPPDHPVLLQFPQGR